MKNKNETVNPEWSYFVEAEKIGDKPFRIMIKPSPDERKALARRLGLKALELLQAEVTFRREAGKIHAEGSFEAQVKQECVVSRKPLLNDIHENFTAWFADREKTVPLARARKERMMEKGHEEIPILEENEDPEPLVDGKIDAGELVTQFLSLAIDPYPHAEGVEYNQGDEESFKGEPLENPFAALKDWKKKNTEV